MCALVALDRTSRTKKETRVNRTYADVGYTYDSFDFTTQFQTWDYSSGLKNDLWRFNVTNESWTKLAEDGEADGAPSQRAFHAASYAGGKLYVHGGNDYFLGNSMRGGTSLMKLCGLDDMWAFDFETSSWTSLKRAQGTCSGISAAAGSDLSALAASLSIALCALSYPF